MRSNSYLLGYLYDSQLLRNDVKCVKGKECGRICIPKNHNCRGSTVAAKSPAQTSKAENIKTGGKVLAALGLIAVPALAGAAVYGLSQKKKADNARLNNDPVLINRRDRYTAKMNGLAAEIGGLRVKELLLKNKHNKTRSSSDYKNYSCNHLDMRIKSDEWFNMHFNLIADEYDSKKRRDGDYRNDAVNSRQVFIARHAQREDMVNPEFEMTATRAYDTPLSKQGLKQAQEMAEQLRGKNIKAIYVSPFYRTVQTANAVAQELDLPLRIEPGLSEWHNPEWQKKKPEYIDVKALKKEFSRIDTSYKPIRQPKYPETASDVLTRAGQTARDLVASSKDNVLMVGHGPSVIGAARGLTKTSPPILPKLAGVVELQGDGNKWNVANGGKLWSPVKNPPKC